MTTENKKELYVSLSKPLKFSSWMPNSLNKPMGLVNAENIINPNNEYNKLGVLSCSEINEIKNKTMLFKRGKL